MNIILMNIMNIIFIKKYIIYKYIIFIKNFINLIDFKSENL